MQTRADSVARWLFLTGALVTSAHLTAAELAPCPASPNCVSSKADAQDSHYVEPLQGQGSRSDSMTALQSVLNALPRVSTERKAEDHLQAVFTSRIFRFKDDVDFVVDETGKIDVRSASRVGYSDLGANRSRVEMLREKLSDLPEE